MTENIKRNFLIKELPEILKNLSPETKGNFGLMTPQHMVEHLVVVIKTAAKKYEGERESPPNERQIGFQKFIRNGAVLKHRPSDKTKADLPPLKYSSLEEIVALMPEAVQRFYNLWDANPDYIPYAPFMGEMSFEEVEFFHYMHFRFHLWQFGLIAEYP